MVGDRVIIGFLCHFLWLKENNSEVKNAKLQTIKTALTGKENVIETTFSREAKVKQKI